MRRFISLILLAVSISTYAQVGEYRNDFAIGVNGGYQLNSIAFVQKVPQSMHGGINGGLTFRYTCEKYFNSICAIQLEMNYAEQGWKEKILDINDEPCINEISGLPEEYERSIKYFQVPVLAHLGWGREVKGAKAFINMGPQFGYLLSESTKTNFDHYYALNTIPDRVNTTFAQDSMAVEHKMDYGIVAGAGVEFSMGRLGHLILEARYYYGLGNIFGDSKADFFSRSNHNSIIFKGAYLFDIVRTKGAKRK